MSKTKNNERNAGRKLKFGEKTETIQIKVPKTYKEEIKAMFYKLLERFENKPYEFKINSFEVYSKNEIDDGVYEMKQIELTEKQRKEISKILNYDNH